MDHFFREKSWFSDRDDDDISRTRDIADIRSRTITACDGRSSIDEHEGHWFSDDIGSADNYDLFSLHVDMIVPQKGHNPFRSTAPEAIVSEEHISNLLFRESVDILRWIDTLGDRISVDVRGEGSLDDNPMDFLISWEALDFFFEGSLIDGNRESIHSEIHPDFTSPLLLHADIGEARRILPDEDDGEHRSFLIWSEGDLIFYIFEDGSSDNTSVKEHKSREIMVDSGRCR